MAAVIVGGGNGEEKPSKHGEEFNNFLKFITTTLQAVRRSVLQVDEARPNRLEELPGTFEREQCRYSSRYA